MANVPRVTQEVAEAVRSADSPSIQVTQEVAEAVRSADSPSIQVTQVVAEVVRKASAPPFRASGVYVDVLRGIPPAQQIKVSQVVVELVREEPLSEGQLSQVNLEVARPAKPEPRPGLPSWMVFDQDHTIDVRMYTGIPPGSAANDIAVLNGANVGLLGTEIIQWVTSTDLGNNVYRLSRLLRGRLGTELSMSSHSVGETFVILDADSVRRVVQNTNDTNAERFFKIVGSGLPVYSATVTGFVNTGLSQKPWKPAIIRSTRDGPGEITITFHRRTRLDYEWRDFVDVPLGQQQESYEMDILDNSGNVVRTLESTTEQFIYTVANQTTDFGGTQSHVAVVIYQMSNLVGRGYPANAVV